MTFPDFLSEWLKDSKAKIKNPLIFAFIVALVFFNWRGIAVFFLSDYSIEARINIIDDRYSGWCRVIIPLLVAVLFLIISKYAMYYADKLSKFAITNRSKLNSDTTLENLLSQKEVEIQKFEIKKIQTGIKENEELRVLNHSIEQEKIVLQNQLEELTNTSATATEDFKNLITELRKEKISLQNEIIFFNAKNKTLMKLFGVDNILEEFDNSELDFFVEFINYNIYRRTNSVTVRPELEDRLQKMGLYGYDDNQKVKLTEKGTFIYEYWRAK